MNKGCLSRSDGSKLRPGLYGQATRREIRRNWMPSYYYAHTSGLTSDGHSYYTYGTAWPDLWDVATTWRLAATTHYINLPFSDVRPGDLFLGVLAPLTPVSSYSLDGFTPIQVTTENSLRATLLYRVCDGNEGRLDPLTGLGRVSTATLDASTACAAVIAHIKNVSTKSRSNSPWTPGFIASALSGASRVSPGLTVGRGTVPHLWLHWGINAVASVHSNAGGVDSFVMSPTGQYWAGNNPNPIVALSAFRYRYLGGAGGGVNFGAGTSNNRAWTTVVAAEGYYL